MSGEYFLNQNWQRNPMRLFLKYSREPLGHFLAIKVHILAKNQIFDTLESIF